MGTTKSEKSETTEAPSNPAPEGRPVIVCTSHRGVFFGYATDTDGDHIHLKRARMAVRFGTTRGVMQLAETGPTSSTLASAPADIDVRSVTAVFEVTPEAAQAWEAAK
jgi:hypothetical protein